ncbi:MAG: homoserine kinase [Thermoanaerobaculia bacterium]|nr:homoserine kinase [Thermoanaerobaculia bacterium]
MTEGISAPRTVRAFAPGSLSNLGCGVDTLGVALEGIGDTVLATRSEVPGVRIEAVRGDGGRLPVDADHNTCGIAALSLLRSAGSTEGIVLELDKGLPLGSGLGSSAASAVAAVVAVDALLDLRSTRDQLLAATLDAEEATCGARHPDNVAPSLWGGWVAVRQGEPFEVLSLPVPTGLAFVVVRPAIELATRTMRELLPSEIPFAEARNQWSNLAALVHALHTGDLELLGRSMVDEIAEPRRAGQIPGFGAACRAAKKAGALSVGLSGSGPSLFALARDHQARGIEKAMSSALAEATGLEVQRLISALPASGARVLDDSGPTR